MIKEWSTAYPSAQDVLGTVQPDLVNGADDTRVSQIHTVRDKLDAAAQLIGDTNNLPSGCLRERVQTLETSDGYAIHRNVASELSLLTEELIPASADLLVIEKAAGGKRKVQIGNLPGGSSGIDRTLIFSDDTELGEAGGTWATKKTFRIIRDADLAPITWRILVSLYTSGGASEVAECRLLAGTDPTFLNAALYDELSPALTHNTSTETLKVAELAISAKEPVDTILYVAVQIRRTGSGGTGVFLKYTDIYALYM